MNIHQKLIEIRKSVRYLAKDNKGYQYSYVSSAQALASVREAMNATGVLIIPDVLSSGITERETKSGGRQYMTELHMRYTLVNAEDPKDTISIIWYGQGVDDAEKGVGKALTYAEKYLILKLFNIPTDKDDPDRHANASPPSDATDTRKAMTPEQRVTINGLAANPLLPQAKRDVISARMRAGGYSRESAGKLIVSATQYLESAAHAATTKDLNSSRKREEA
jgi:hypothetical protein